MKYIFAAVAFLYATPVFAQDAPVFNYEMFETAIQHVDLLECPAELAGDDRFCRMTINNGALHVFAFGEKGEQPMIGLRMWHEDEIKMTFE